MVASIRTADASSFASPASQGHRSGKALIRLGLLASLPVLDAITVQSRVPSVLSLRILCAQCVLLGQLSSGQQRRVSSKVISALPARACTVHGAVASLLLTPELQILTPNNSPVIWFTCGTHGCPCRWGAYSKRQVSVVVPASTLSQDVHSC